MKNNLNSAITEFSKGIADTFRILAQRKDLNPNIAYAITMGSVTILGLAYFDYKKNK